MARSNLDVVAAAARAHGLPPVHLWNPANCGTIDIVIGRNGQWFHEGSPIGREALVRLFSTVLRKDPEGFVLVTPAEKLTITVEDAPFVAVRVDRRGEALRFVTNVGDEVEAGPDHPIRVESDGEFPRPYVHVRADLEALISRPVFYELAEMAERKDTARGPMLGVTSNGAWFAIGAGRGGRDLTAPASGTALRDWMARHLDPLAATTGAPTRSDFDLDPAMASAEAGVLTPAAVLVGLVERNGTLAVILTRRADSLRRHTGQIALPGGRCEAGETPWEAAVREAHEEIGLHPALVDVVGLSTPYRTGTGFFVTPVVGMVDAAFEATPNPDEVAEVFETPFGFLMDPANHVRQEMRTPEGRRRRFYAMTWEDRRIWGATAGMLRALYDRLYGAAVA